MLIFAYFTIYARTFSIRLSNSFSTEYSFYSVCTYTVIVNNSSFSVDSWSKWFRILNITTILGYYDKQQYNLPLRLPFFVCVFSISLKCFILSLFFNFHEYCSSYLAADSLYCPMYGFSRLHGFFEVWFYFPVNHRIPEVKAGYIQENNYMFVLCAFFWTLSVFSFQGSLADLTRCTEYALIEISKSLGRPYYFPKIMCCYHHIGEGSAALCISNCFLVI